MADELISLFMLPQNTPLMIALVGAGGKTTTMLALAKAYAAAGKRVLITTTTRIYVPSEAAIDRLVILPEKLDWAAEEGTITAMGAATEKNGKLVGLSSDQIEEIYASNGFDILLIEADGASGRSIKAPEEHEPVIPGGCTHVIGIIGMDAFGQPMDEIWVHRLERFLAITGGERNQRIDGYAIKKLIGSPEGLFKNAPFSALRILLLNKCTDHQQREAAEALISECLKRGIGDLSLGVCL